MNMRFTKFPRLRPAILSILCLLLAACEDKKEAESTIPYCPAVKDLLAVDYFDVGDVVEVQGKKYKIHFIYGAVNQDIIMNFKGPMKPQTPEDFMMLGVQTGEKVCIYRRLLFGKLKSVLALKPAG